MTRGYYGIGIENCKTEANIGTLWRSAYCFGAAFIFTIGARYHHQCSDTVKAFRHIPYWRFANWDDFCQHIPYDCQVIGIEIDAAARPLSNFVHPERVIYVLGAEDNGLTKGALEYCQYSVSIPSVQCLNVAR